MSRELIPKSELVEGGIYRIRSRNLNLGVYDGQGGMIGIREKFGSHFLSTEYLAEDGGAYGTVRVLEKIGDLPEGVPIKARLGSRCSNCNGKAWWTGPPAPAPWECEGNCKETLPYSHQNEALYNVLDFEQACLAERCWSCDSVVEDDDLNCPSCGRQMKW